MNFTIEFFRVRSTDDLHATLDRISVAADNLEAAKVKAKSLFETLDMPQKPGRAAHLGSGGTRVVRLEPRGRCLSPKGEKPLTDAPSAEVDLRGAIAAQRAECTPIASSRPSIRTTQRVPI